MWNSKWNMNKVFQFQFQNKKKWFESTNDWINKVNELWKIVLRKFKVEHDKSITKKWFDWWIKLLTTITFNWKQKSRNEFDPQVFEITQEIKFQCQKVKNIN